VYRTGIPNPKPSWELVMHYITADFIKGNKFVKLFNRYGLIMRRKWGPPNDYFTFRRIME
jgi:hypothetical protein